MIRRTLISFLFAIFTAGAVFAMTDPEPNPFENILDGEQVVAGNVVESSEEILSVANPDGETFSGRMEAISKYRDGGGPAAAEEFFAGDAVRILVDAENVILAAQNSELKLCDQTFYGWVREPTESEFTLETIDGENFEVRIGATTQFRDENSKRLFGYSPLAGNVVKIHGVVNENVGKIFTETFGTYISLLDEDALAPFLEEVAARKAEKAAALAAKLAEQKFDDVPPESEHFFAVNFIANEEIVGGHDDGSFAPDAEINRAELTKILVETKFADELAEFELPAESCFPDVPLDAWFAPFVCFAQQNAIISGYPDGEFKPANAVNLAEAITILVQTFKFSVEEAEGEWFAPFVERAESLAILPEDFGEPAGNLSRGKMAELVMRALKYTRGELVDYLANLNSENDSEK